MAGRFIAALPIALLLLPALGRRSHCWGRRGRGGRRARRFLDRLDAGAAPVLVAHRGCGGWWVGLGSVLGSWVWACERMRHARMGPDRCIDASTDSTNALPRPGGDRMMGSIVGRQV